MSDWVAQGSPDWIRERIGHLTASRMARAMSYKKDGKESAERYDLKIELLQERLADAAVEHYVSPAMQWGIDNEPSARAEFELRENVIVKPMGFVLHKSIDFFGASPDGMLLQKEGLEIKCPTTKMHLKYLLNGTVPEEYKPQMIAQCVCAGFDRVHFLSYDPRLPNKTRYFKIIYEPTKEEREKVEAEAVKFLKEVEEMFDKLTRS